MANDKEPTANFYPLERLDIMQNKLLIRIHYKQAQFDETYVSLSFKLKKLNFCKHYPHKSAGDFKVYSIIAWCW